MRPIVCSAASTRFAVGVVDDRHHGGRGMAAGDAVDAGLRVIHRVGRTAVGELGDADARRVAVRLVGQAADEDPLAADVVLVSRGVVVVFAADDVGVHAGAADVLADLVDDQQVARRRTGSRGSHCLARTSSSSSRSKKSCGATASIRAVSS